MHIFHPQFYLCFFWWRGGEGRRGLSFYIGIPVVRDFDVGVAVDVNVLLLVAVAKVVVVVVVSLFPLVFSWREMKHNFNKLSNNYLSLTSRLTKKKSMKNFF